MLYSEILDRIEAADGDVFNARARVSTARKALVVGRGIIGR
jgi:phytoene synthase